MPLEESFTKLIMAFKEVPLQNVKTTMKNDMCGPMNDYQVK